MKKYPIEEIVNIMIGLLVDGYLILDHFNIIRLSKKARSVLVGEEKYLLKLRKRKKEDKKKDDENVCNKILFDNLKDMRLKLAKKEKVPPYIICNNRTLVELANSLHLI